jgi:hypothetical protein
MSDVIKSQETTNILTFEESILEVNTKYISFLTELIEKFKYHDDLIGPLEHDLKLTNDKLQENKYQVIDTMTDNFLFCLEQISDHNSDYFIYQKEKIVKKNGKAFKNKLPKVGNRTLLKKILKEAENKYVDKIFLHIIELFNYLTLKDGESIVFKEEYISYVKEKFNENKNYSKMIMVFDNINNILNSKIEEIKEIDDNEIDDVEEIKDKNKKIKKNSKSSNKKNSKSSNNDFMKNLENTKIAELAKNISKKINMEDFPALSDPSKLLSSLAGGNTGEDGGGIQNLLKFVIGEVEDAFKSEKLNEKDLMGEAQNIMGQFKNMSGIDPMSLLSGNKDKFDLNQFANIFANMDK